MSRKNYSRYTDYENYTMLSDRELEVLKMKNSGDSNGKIAEKIGIKYNTVSIYLTKATQKIDGVYDYDRERAYKNNGAKKRREDPEYRLKYNQYNREYYRKNHEKRTPVRKKKVPRALTAQEIEKRRKYYRDYYRKRHPKKERKNMVITGPSKLELYILASDQRAEKIIEEKEAGKTIREIAKEQGCSTQNIYEILRRYRLRMENRSQL